VQSGGRVGCVRIPRFPIGAVWRETDLGNRAQLALSLDGTSSSPPPTDAPHWDTRPRALVVSQRLTTVTAAAARSGVRAGMTVSEARGSCAALEARPWDERTIAHTVSRLTAALLAAAPQVTPVTGAPGTWWVGADGFEGIGGERALARTLLGIARRWHPEARVSIAGSCVVARAATWTQGASASGLVVVPRGGDAAYLATVPLSLLPMDAELRETFGALGIRTAGELALLPSEDVERRWGAEGLAVLRLARGEDPRRAWLARADAPRTAQADLPSPSATMEPVLFLVQGALGRLARELHEEGRAAAIITITLALDTPSALPSGAPRHTMSREARLARPSARPDVLLEHCRALLERWTLPAPVTGVGVAITATARTAGGQGELLANGRRDDAAAAAVTARLAAALGADAVVRPAARDAHAPERGGAWVPVGDEEMESAPPTRGVIEEAGVATATAAATDRALRLLQPPEAVEVEHAAGIPCAMWWRGARVPLRRVQGPERLSGDWWRDDAYRRDYWRCESETGGGSFVVFQASDAWFVHGWYD
jgi:protein ImuB